MNNSLVSVIIPAYNAANYLREAIDSALAQTYGSVEIIVVNDGSTDDGATERVALEYGDKIRYFTKENGGCASALNYGIDVMKGEWFSWLSHDDLYLPDKIRYMLEALDKNGLDPENTVIVSDTVLINGDGHEVSCPFKQTKGLLSPAQAFKETLVIKTFNGCGMLIPKKVIDKTGYFITDYKHQLDREYWMRIAIGGSSFFVVDKSLVKSRVHNRQITVNAQNLLSGEESKLIEEYIAASSEPGKTDFLLALSFFAYKRQHYHQGKAIKKMIKKAGELNLSTRADILKYSIKGKLNKLVRNLYKNMIRR